MSDRISNINVINTNNIITDNVDENQDKPLDEKIEIKQNELTSQD